MKEPQRLVSFRGYAIDTFIPFHVCMKAGTSYFAESKYGNTNVLKLLSSKKRHLVIPVTYGVSWTALDPFIFFFFFSIYITYWLTRRTSYSTCYFFWTQRFGIGQVCCILKNTHIIR